MAYGDFKDLVKRTASVKLLWDKSFTIAKNLKYDRCQRGLASMVYKFFDKKSASVADKSAAGSRIKNEITQKQQLAEELHKQIIRKLKKRRVCSSFKFNIWGADLADIQLISKFDKGIRFLLCVIDIYSKYTWVIPLNTVKKDVYYAKIKNIEDKIFDITNWPTNTIRNAKINEIKGEIPT